MKYFGSISRLVSILFRKDGQDITVRPNQSTTYTTARDIQLPAGDSDAILASEAQLSLKYDASNPDGYVNATQAAAAAPVQSVASKTGAVTLVKADVGLANVDNTSDANKPISTATQNALDNKYDVSNPLGFVNAVQASLAAPVQSVAGKTGNVSVNKSDVGLGNVPNLDATDPTNITQSPSFRFVTDTEKSTWNGKQNALGFTPENSANKGVANGYAPLNASGRIDNSYLDSTAMNYHGSWDAATNTPTLADGMVGADPGDVYIVSVGGTRNLGSGSITFVVGDWVIYNQSNVWEKVSNSVTVASVNGATGAVTVNAINELTGDVTAGPASGSESKAATIAAGAITDSKVSASAAIAVSKLATGTNGQVLQVVAGVPTWGAAPVSVLAYKTDWNAADGVTKAITHSLGTTDVLVQIFDKSSGESININSIIRSSNNALSLTASEAPGVSGWRVLILAI